MVWGYIVGAAVAAATAFYAYRKFVCMRYFKRLGIPGPEPHFLFGNLRELLSEDRHEVMGRWARKYGDIYGYFEGPLPILVVGSMEAVEQVCVKQFAAFQGHRVVPVQPDAEKDPDNPLNHLLFAQGERWKRLRTTVNSSFSSGKLKSYTPLLRQCENNLMELFASEAAAGNSFDIRATFQFLTLDVIAQVAFNVDFQAIRNRGKGNPVLENLHEFLEVSSSPSAVLDTIRVFPGCAGPLRYLITLQLKKMTGMFRSIGVLLDLVGQIMNQRKTDPANHRNDLLQLMMDAGERTINEQEIKAMSFLFFVAGYETTSTTLGFISYCLAANKDVQEKLREEIYSKYPKDQRNIQPDYDIVMNLPYLDWCCREAMRLYPIAYSIVSRFVVENTELCGIPVSSDLGAVMVDMYSIHHNPDLWGPVDTKKFYPERFSPENSANRPDAAFMAFGYGPRQCVGMRLGLLEMKMTLTMLLHRFRIEEPAGGFPACGLETTSREGFLIPKKVDVKLSALY